MKQVRIYLTALSLSVAFASYSQDYRTQARTYEQRQQDNKVAEQRVHQQYLNNLPNRSSSTLGNNAASAEWERLFKKQPSSVQVSPEEQLKRRLEFSAQWHRDIEKANQFEKLYGTLADTLKAAGFTYPEAYTLSKYGLNASKGDHTALLEVMNAKLALRDFKAMASTASYEELLKLALSYRMAGLSCISSLRRIEMRFPEKKGDIDLMVLEVIPECFTYKHTTLDIEQPSTGQQTYISNMFLSLLEKFPLEANRAAGSCLVSPYESAMVLDWMKTGNLDQKAAVFMYILQHRQEAAGQAHQNKADNTQNLASLKGCARFFKLHPSYLKDLSASEWNQIASAKDIPLNDLKAYLGINP